MAEQKQQVVVKPKLKMSQVIASDFTQSLGSSLGLTEEQKAKAKSAALMLSGDSKLKDCDTYSIVKYCFETARYNFTKDDSIYPVPYSGKIQAQVSYQGLRELAMRSHRYSNINAVVVKDCDQILRNEEGEPIVNFESDFKKAHDSATYGYYAYARDLEGKIVKSILMTVKECEIHKAKFAKASAIWQSNFEKMALKTVMKQLCRQLDISSNTLLKEALKQDQLVYGAGEDLNNNTYADNPQNQPVVIMSDAKERQQTEVVNTLAPSKEVQDAITSQLEEEENTVIEGEVIENKEDIKKEVKQEATQQTLTEATENR